MAEIVVNGIRTWYDEEGTGETVVLVHGLGGTGQDIWKKVIAELAVSYRVLVYDLRGSGQSDAPPGPYTIEGLADDLQALLVELGHHRVAIFGHSMGGGIALELAGRDPARVRAVVGVGAVAQLPDGGRQGMATRADTVEAEGMAAVAETVATNGLAPSFREGHPEEFQEFISLLASNRPEGYAAQCRALVTMAVPLERVTAPVLLVSGALDQASPPAMNEANAARLKDARFVEVPDAAHILPWEKPRDLLDAALPFLRDA
jgi:3-oxoadipate enol-lactonase